MSQFLHVNQECKILGGHPSGYLLTFCWSLLHVHHDRIEFLGAKLRQKVTGCMNIFFQKSFMHPAKSSKMLFSGGFIAILTRCEVVKTLKGTAKRIGFIVTAESCDT